MIFKHSLLFLLFILFWICCSAQENIYLKLPSSTKTICLLKYNASKMELIVPFNDIDVYYNLNSFNRRCSKRKFYTISNTQKLISLDSLVIDSITISHIGDTLIYDCYRQYSTMMHLFQFKFSTEVKGVKYIGKFISIDFNSIDYVISAPRKSYYFVLDNKLYFVLNTVVSEKGGIGTWDASYEDTVRWFLISPSL